MKSHLRFALGAAALALLNSAAFAAPTFAITGPATSSLGASFTLNVQASDFADLYGYQFDVSFNPSRYRFDRIAEGSFLASAGSTYFGSGSVDNAAGSVSFIFDTLLGTGPGARGSGVLASLSFTTIGAGSSTFALTNVGAVDSALSDVTVATQSLAAVALVPEPSTWAFMAGGLGVLGAVARRHRV